MGEKAARARPDEERVSLGVPGVDAMLDGGLVPHRPYLIVGASGTGKTTLALQFLCEGIRRGERGLYVTVENPPNEIRVNHRALAPELDRVEVFDAIPDVMRYEKAPFKDISSVREIIPFAGVPIEIRQSPEFTSVEVTVAALEQMLRAEVPRRKYARIVIDSLTALQYFCMKGLDTVSTAQTFLRFLSDLGATVLLTVEAPLEEVETPERTLARGEVRLFRWELEGQTVRAIGVEKFRGSSHDVRLHPYRLGPKGLDVNLDLTISRDTRRIVEPALRVVAPALAGTTAPPVVVSEAVRDLLTLGADVAPVREEVEATLADLGGKAEGRTEAHLARIASLVIALAQPKIEPPSPPGALTERQAAAVQRAVERADRARTGVPPSRPPPPDVLKIELENVLALLTPPAAAPPGPVARPVPATLSPPTPLGAVPPVPPPAARKGRTGGSVALDRWSTTERTVPAERPGPPSRGATSPAPAAAGPPAGRTPIPDPPPLPVGPPNPPAPSRSAPPPPRGPPPAPHPSPPAASGTPSVPSASPTSAPLLPAPPTPPPMPSAPSGPPPMPGPALAEAAPTAPTAGPGATAPPPPPPRRRRRSKAAKSAGAADAATAGGAAAPEKPKRRTVRRRKAPPVVGAVEETVPPAALGNEPPKDPPPEGG